MRPLHKRTVVGKVCLMLCLMALSCLLSACSPDKFPPLKIGDKGPDFSARDLHNTTITLSSFSGHPVVLRFFLIDCKFCRADTPVFNTYYNRYKDKGLQIVYIDTNGTERKAIETFVDDLSIPFPVVRDIDGTIAAKYNVKALPQTIILNPDQKIIAAILGGVSEAELRKLLSPYLL